MLKLLSALRSLVAVFAGYVAIALGTTLTFEVWLGGIGYHQSSPGTLALATAGALLSGIAGGLLAASLAGRRPLLHGLALILPIAADTGYVVSSGISSDPLWFDLGGAAVLVGGGILGAWLVERWRGVSSPASAAEALPRI